MYGDVGDGAGAGLYYNVNDTVTPPATVTLTSCSTPDPVETAMSFSDASIYCDSLSESGQDDWSLPTALSLHSIYLPGGSDFSLNNFWSSDTKRGDATTHYYVSMSDGTKTATTDGTAMVRCVR